MYPEIKFISTTVRVIAPDLSRKINVAQEGQVNFLQF